MITTTSDYATIRYQAGIERTVALKALARAIRQTVSRGATANRKESHFAASHTACKTLNAC